MRVVRLDGGFLLEYSKFFLERRPRLFLPLGHEFEEPIRVICINLGYLHAYWLHKLLLSSASHSAGVGLEDRCPLLLLLLLSVSCLRLLTKHGLLLALSEDWHSSLSVSSSCNLAGENIARAGGAACERRWLDCLSCLLLGGDRCLGENSSGLT